MNEAKGVKKDSDTIPAEILETFEAKGFHRDDVPLLLQCRELPVCFREFVYGARYLAKPGGYLWP